MKIVGSQRPTESKEFRENYSVMEIAIEKVDSLAKRLISGGSENSKARHLKRGKMLPRDRVANLLDVGSFFLEVGLFAAHGEYKDEVPSAGELFNIGVLKRPGAIVTTLIPFWAKSRAIGKVIPTTPPLEAE